MNLFTWKKDFESGIKIIDDEHKELFIHFNNFIIKSRVSINPTVTLNSIRKFQNLAEAHYEAELSFMTTSGYLNTKEHKAMHLGILFAAKRLYVEVSAMEPSSMMAEKIYDFMRHTAYDHFIKEDVSFIHYYRDFILGQEA